VTGRTIGVLLALLLALSACTSGSEQASTVQPPTVQPPTVQCPPSPADPAALACRITAAQVTIHDRGTTPEALAAAGRDEQNAYRLLGDHPEWDAAVLHTLTPALAARTRLAVDADRQLLSLASPPPGTLPAWRVVAPLPVGTLRGFYDQAQRRFGVNWTVLAAVNLVETSMCRVVGLSTAGAQGPMQFIPSTWARYGLGGNVWDPYDAITGAANYLAANGGADPAQLDHALRRYNNDVRYMRAVRDYAAILAADPDALVGLHAWPVVFRTNAGDITLTTGYSADHLVPVQQWLAEHPASQGQR
jgi:hypothetical protein